MDCAGPSLLHVGVLQLQRVGVTLSGSAQVLGTEAFSSSRALTQKLVVLWHVGSSQTRGQVKPMSPALADRFITTELPGKSPVHNILLSF